MLYIFTAWVGATKGIWRIQSPRQTKSDAETTDSHRIWCNMEQSHIPLLLLKDSVSSTDDAHDHQALTAFPGLAEPHKELIYSNSDAVTSSLAFSV